MPYKMFQGHCHNRYRIGWRRSPYMGRIHSSKKRSWPSHCSANICWRVMETVSLFDIWKIRRTSAENMEKIWRMCVCVWSVLVLPSCCTVGLHSKVSLECLIFLISTSYSFEIFCFLKNSPGAVLASVFRTLTLRSPPPKKNLPNQPT